MYIVIWLFFVRLIDFVYIVLVFLEYIKNSIFVYIYMVYRFVLWMLEVCRVMVFGFYILVMIGFGVFCILIKVCLLK